MVGPQVFISYRRTDTAGWAGRLVADLRHRLGAGARIFMDVDAIPAGENFASYIDRSVAGSDALIALIGPSWLDARDENGRRRIDAPADFVRLEIEAALRRGIRVIPALVDGAHISTAAELPHSLGHLVDLQAVRFDNENWEIGIGRIVAPFVREAPAPEPRLEVTTGRIDFGYLVTQQPWPRRTVQLRNAGAGELNPSCTTQDGWLVLRQRDDALDVLVDTSHPGEYEGRILVRSAGGSAEIVVPHLWEWRARPLREVPSANLRSPDQRLQHTVGRRPRSVHRSPCSVGGRSRSVNRRPRASGGRGSGPP
ncbi:toll/interleukin-1 receptor domain-containing protein [Frankia sp. Cppng1_Ct_nod]|uniref:toll/interleukin-1 receptor domain-containing protein n=1 Tax=Frankia sp. Cppng1_Ct_nod TaxID=2897162 RepID=UPI0013EF731D|nr:toll/interleukin-1 receptor domain-containing protein [Frankia sp. Cppng1_Ct_nod]